jgi:hypothetical protein
MSDSVSDILTLRAASEPRFSKSVWSSVVVHVLGVAALFLSHEYLITHRKPAPKIMTITLGGSIGPRSTGMNAAGARPVDIAAPQPKHEPIKTAASQASTMTLPIKSEPKPTVDKALPITSMPKPPTVGEQVRQGTALAETGSTSSTKGLTIGGSGGGAPPMLEIADFCCPEYLQGVVDRIQSVWNKNVPERGEATLRFVIKRDGTITDITTDKTTSRFLELQSLSALARARLDSLPAAFKDDHLVIHLRFPYGIQ